MMQNLGRCPFSTNEDGLMQECHPNCMALMYLCDGTKDCSKVGACAFAVLASSTQRLFVPTRAHIKNGMVSIEDKNDQNQIQASD